MPATLFTITTGIQVPCLTVSLEFHLEQPFDVHSHVLVYLLVVACEPKHGSPACVPRSWEAGAPQLKMFEVSLGSINPISTVFERDLLLQI